MLCPMATERPLRADAERNRRRILDAAAGLFAERGLDVSMEEIASTAGVGVGTLYRRFPDRGALIDALFLEKIETLVGIAQAGLAVEDPWEGFAMFFRAACRNQAVDRGLREAMLSAGGDRLATGRDRIRPVAQQLIGRAQAAGVLRADVSAFDIPMLHFSIGHAASTTRAAAPDYYERLVAIALDGLRSRPDGSTPMTAAPLTPDEFTRSLTHKR